MGILLIPEELVYSASVEDAVRCSATRAVILTLAMWAYTPCAVRQTTTLTHKNASVCVYEALAVAAPSP